MKVVIPPSLFLNNPTYFTDHFIFMGKIWTLLFFKNFENGLTLLPPSLIKCRGRGLHSLRSLGKKIIYILLYIYIYIYILASNFLIFLSNRFAILHIFHKQLKSGDSTGSCLWLWLNFHLKALRQLVWRLLQRWKNPLDWKKCPISMFSEISSPCKHVLAALFRK